MISVPENHKIFKFFPQDHTVCFTYVDRGSQMIIFKSILTTFKGCWSNSKNWPELKIEPPWANLACLNWWNTLQLNSFSNFLIPCLLNKKTLINGSYRPKCNGEERALIQNLRLLKWASLTTGEVVNIGPKQIHHCQA